jgi:hypothetical protein
MASHVITTAISGVRNVWEYHGSDTECHGFTWVLAVLIRHLHVDFTDSGSCTLEVSGDTNNERHAAFTLT